MYWTAKARQKAKNEKQRIKTKTIGPSVLTLIIPGFLDVCMSGCSVVPLYIKNYCIKLNT